MSLQTVGDIREKLESYSPSESLQTLLGEADGRSFLATLYLSLHKQFSRQELERTAAERGIVAQLPQVPTKPLKPLQLDPTISAHFEEWLRDPSTFWYPHSTSKICQRLDNGEKPSHSAIFDISLQLSKDIKIKPIYDILCCIHFADFAEDLGHGSVQHVMPDVVKEAFPNRTLTKEEINQLKTFVVRGFECKKRLRDLISLKEKGTLGEGKDARCSRGVFFFEGRSKFYTKEHNTQYRVSKLQSLNKQDILRISQETQADEVATVLLRYVRVSWQHTTGEQPSDNRETDSAAHSSHQLNQREAQPSTNQSAPLSPTPSTQEEPPALTEPHIQEALPLSGSQQWFECGLLGVRYDNPAEPRSVGTPPDSAPTPSEATSDDSHGSTSISPPVPSRDSQAVQHSTGQKRVSATADFYESSDRVRRRRTGDEQPSVQQGWDGMPQPGSGQQLPGPVLQSNDGVARNNHSHLQTLALVADNFASWTSLNAHGVMPHFGYMPQGASISNHGANFSRATQGHHSQPVESASHPAPISSSHSTQFRNPDEFQGTVDHFGEAPSSEGITQLGSVFDHLGETSFSEGITQLGSVFDHLGETSYSEGITDLGAIFDGFGDTFNQSVTMPSL